MIFLNRVQANLKQLEVRWHTVFNKKLKNILMKNSSPSNRKIKRSVKNSLCVFVWMDAFALNLVLLIEFFLFCLQNTANTHNDNICREIRVMFENKMLNGIGNTYLSDDAFISLFMRSKVEALDDVSYCIPFINKLRFH